MQKKEFIIVGDILHKLIQIAINVQTKSGKKLKDFEIELISDNNYFIFRSMNKVVFVCYSHISTFWVTIITRT